MFMPSVWSGECDDRSGIGDGENATRESKPSARGGKRIIGTLAMNYPGAANEFIDSLSKCTLHGIPVGCLHR